MSPATATVITAAVADSLGAEPRQAAVKGWSVSASRAIDKGQVVAGVPPLLVHQTLANRKDVLVCATCHRFVGTEATQLAMLEGLPKNTSANPRGKKKRSRDGDSGDPGSNGESESGSTARREYSSPSSATAVADTRSRRLAVAEAPSSDLPDLPSLTGVSAGQNGSMSSSACDGGANSTPAAGVTTGAAPSEAGGPAANSDNAAMLDGTAVDAVGCSREGVGEERDGCYRCDGGAPCDDVYCSTDCRADAVVAGHGLICAGGRDEGSPLYEFRRYAVRTSETYLIAAAAIASALSVAEGTRPFEALAGWNEPLPQEKEETAEGLSTASMESGGGTAGIHGGAASGIGVPLEEAEEAWSMLAAGLVYGRDSRQAATSEVRPGEEAGNNGAGDGRALALDFFLRMVRALGRHLAPITVPSPLVGYCAQLVSSHPEVTARALPWLSSAIERAGPHGGADCEEDAQGLDGNRGGFEEENNPRDNDGRTMAAERGLCRLVQASSAAANGAANCIPNVQLEASLALAKPPKGTGSALRVGFVTLRGIRARDELFAPYVALGEPVNIRRRELSSLFFGACSSSSDLVCRCPRCLLEAEGDRSCGPEMLKVLADQALEEGRHKTALGLYKAALACPPPPSSCSSPPPPARHVGDDRSQEGNNPAAATATAAAAVAVKGDALHGVGVAMLAAGSFRDARRAFQRGFLEEPLHPSLRAQAEKETAYRPADAESNQKRFELNVSATEAGVAEVSASGGSFGGYDAFTSTPGGAADIFMSRAPALSPEECRDVIQAAGDHARVNGGWTTSRHYAVPTTDLPMHALTPLLPWFRSLLSDRLFPSLAEHFGLAGGAGSVFVHDAFVVRYEEGKQRHLPLHRDQSTHSFTIALNSTEEYSGGGTFFPCLGRALRPPEGHALSFRGGILHGGDPLLKGLRYIIACFCYHDNGHNAKVSRFGSSSSTGIACSTTATAKESCCGYRADRSECRDGGGGGGARIGAEDSPGDSPDDSLDDGRPGRPDPGWTGNSAVSSRAASSEREKHVCSADVGREHTRLGVDKSGQGGEGWEDRGGAGGAGDTGAGKRKGGIEFRSGQAFSFGFGFGDT